MTKTVTLLLAMTLTGCATLVHGTTQEIPIASASPGARVLIDDVPVGVTPMVAKVSRAQPHVVSFVVDSITVDRVALDRHISPWVLPDVFLLYIVPAVVDVKNGAAYNFSSDTLRAGTAPVAAGVRRVPLSPGVRASAMTSSVMIGFGSGHAVVDLPARKFFGLEMAAGSVSFMGLAIGIGGGSNTVAETMFFGGAAALIGARIWEVADLVKRTDPARR